MDSTAILIVLASALLHAAWNFFNKGSPDRWAFFVAQGLVTALVYAPFVFWQWPAEPISAWGWGCVFASALTHAGYAVYLLKSYDAGDLSVAYPLSRTAPILVAAWDVATMGTQLSGLGLSGVVLSGLGALTVLAPALRAHGFRSVLRQRVTRYSLITALFIALYTVIDKQGAGQVPVLVYLYLLTLGEFAMILFWLRTDPWRRMARELRHNTFAVLFVAVLGPFSYLMILWVLTTAPASYVLGLRQSSIVFGVLLGKIFLGESETRYRLIGACIIALGSALIAMAR